jgi:hypothetical protein
LKSNDANQVWARGIIEEKRPLPSALTLPSQHEEMLLTRERFVLMYRGQNSTPEDERKILEGKEKPVSKEEPAMGRASRSLFVVSSAADVCRPGIVIKRSNR